MSGWAGLWIMFGLWAIGNGVHNAAIEIANVWKGERLRRNAEALSGPEGET